MTLVLSVPSQFWNPLISEVQHVPCSSRGMSSIVIHYSWAIPVANSALVPFPHTQGSGVTRSTGFSWTKLISDACRMMTLMEAVVCRTLPGLRIVCGVFVQVLTSHRLWRRRDLKSLASHNLSGQARKLGQASGFALQEDFSQASAAFLSPEPPPFYCRIFRNRDKTGRRPGSVL